MAIEVEKKCLLSESRYKSLPDELLKMGAIDQGNNDTETIFYVLDKAQLKIQFRSSQRKAKLAWKSGGFTERAVDKRSSCILIIKKKKKPKV